MTLGKFFEAIHDGRITAYWGNRYKTLDGLVVSKPDLDSLLPEAKAARDRCRGYSLVGCSFWPR